MAARLKGGVSLNGIKQAEVRIKQGRIEAVVGDNRLAEAVEYARNLYLEIKAIEPAFKEYKEIILAAAKRYMDEDKGSITFIAGDASCKVTFRYECVVPEEAVGELKNLLGKRFDDLVKTRVSYTGRQKLIDEAADADRGKALAGLVEIKGLSPQFKFEAGE